MSTKEENKLKSQKRWFEKTPQEVFHLLETSPEGLSYDEAERRLIRFGENRLAESKRRPWWLLLIKQLASPLVYVLLVAAIISIFLNHDSDALVISIVLLLNTVIGFVQEFRAENAIKSLLNLVSPMSIVCRGGKTKQVESSLLVPGDIVEVGEGDLVSADMRILDSQSLRVSEAPLTGESVPVSKNAETLESLEENPSPSDQHNILFMGTSVTSGKAKAIIVATGGATEIGSIAEKLKSSKAAKAPLQSRLDKLANRIALAISGVSVGLFSLGLFLGRDLEEMFFMAVAVAVSAMPEGLPVVVTIALAISIKRMADRRAIIRHLPAVETLGSTNVIITDKTGTLTLNKMEVKTLWNGEKEYILESLSSASKPLERLLLCSYLNNEAHKKKDIQENWQFFGDAMDIALLQAVEKLKIVDSFSTWQKIDEIPFDSDLRFSASLHKHPSEAEPVILAKGAGEILLELCSQSEVISKAQQVSDRWGEEGLRVLAFVEGTGQETFEILKDKPESLNEKGCFRLLGLIGFWDPPRKEASEAVRECHKAGIRVVMCTGDYGKTALSIARKVGIVTEEETGVGEGSELYEADEEQLDKLMAKANVFARVRPNQKHDLVKAFQKKGCVVTVTGDGVNDAPALKLAHLGAAMGITGTDVAKEASEMVLTDDNFATIFEAVKEGRTAFRNIRMTTFFLVSCALAEVLALSAALPLRWPLMLLPTQILWLNVVTNGILDVALAFEPQSEDLVRKGPRSLEEGILGRNLLLRMLSIGLFMAVGTILMFYWEHYYRKMSLDYAQVSCLTLLVMFQVVHVFNCRSENISILKNHLMKNKFLFFGTLFSLAIHIGALYFPGTQSLLSLRPLDQTSWPVIISVSFLIILVNELDKLRGRSTKN